MIMNEEFKSTIGKYYEKFSRTEIRYLEQRTFVSLVIFPKAVCIV